MLATGAKSNRRRLILNIRFYIARWRARRERGSHQRRTIIQPVVIRRQWSICRWMPVAPKHALGFDVVTNLVKEPEQLTKNDWKRSLLLSKIDIKYGSQMNDLGYDYGFTSVWR